MKPSQKILAKIQTKEFSKTALADTLGISRPTLDKKIVSNKWKKGELAIIESL